MRALITKLVCMPYDKVNRDYVWFHSTKKKSKSNPKIEPQCGLSKILSSKSALKNSKKKMFVCLFVTEATTLECQDGLQTSKVLIQTRELGQSPRNMSAIDGKIAQYNSFFTATNRETGHKTQLLW